MSVSDGTGFGVQPLDGFLAVWCGWQRNEGTAPNWSRFRPLEHPRLLPHVMLYERIEGRFRCAIVGEQAAASLPIRLAGRFIDEAMPPENLADVTQRLTKALSTGMPNFVEKTMAWEPGRDLVAYCALQLPFAGKDDINPRVLSVMRFHTKRI